MDTVGVERAHLFGVSEGGALSIASAAQHPAGLTRAMESRVRPTAADAAQAMDEIFSKRSRRHATPENS